MTQLHKEKLLLDKHGHLKKIMLLQILGIILSVVALYFSYCFYKDFGFGEQFLAGSIVVTGLAGGYMLFVKYKTHVLKQKIELIENQLKQC